MKVRQILKKSVLVTLLSSVAPWLMAQGDALRGSPEAFREGEFWRFKNFVVLPKPSEEETTRQVVEVFSDGYAWMKSTRASMDSTVWALFDPRTGNQALVRRFDPSLPAPHRGAKVAVNPSDGFPFPLEKGKTLTKTVEWRNKMGSSVLTYTVEGPETVKVPAGTFSAWKVVQNGTWAKHGDPDMQGTEEYINWYSPEVKAIVKREAVRYLKGRVMWKEGTTLIEWRPSQSTETTPAPVSADLDAR